MYKVYVKTNEAGDITAINSDAFLPEPVPEGWILIDEGSEDKYRHAQSNYLLGGLWNEDCTEYRYRLVNGAPELKD